MNCNIIDLTGKRMNRMNQSSYFNNIADIGSLYLDYVFNYFENEPIIFTCISEYGKIYLCLCSEIRKEQKWIISPCDIFIIKKLIDKEIDIFHALSNYNKVILVVLAQDGSERSEWIDVNEINEFDLPEKNCFLKCDSKEASAYLKKLKNTIFLPCDK